MQQQLQLSQMLKQENSHFRGRRNVIGNGICGNSNEKENNRPIHLLKPLMIKYGFKNGLIINHKTFNLLSKCFVYDSRNANHLLFNFQRFKLIEDANPNFNSCIERKNPK